MRSFWRASFRHHLRIHLPVLGATAVAAAALIGALLCGDSVRHSLAQLTDQRIGGVHFIVRGPSLRRELAETVAQQTGAVVTPVLLRDAILARPGTEARTGGVQLFGVEPTFFQTLGAPAISEGVAVNQALAERLGVREGDVLLLRFRPAGGVPSELPLGRAEVDTLSFRLPVRGIIGPAQGGDFRLDAAGPAPLNAFVPRAELSSRIAQNERADLFVVGAGSGEATLRKALSERARLEDVGLELRSLNGGELSLRSERVILDPTLGRPARSHGALTWLVNEIQRPGDTRKVPYSFVSALDPALLPVPLKDDEILVNAWLAEALSLKIGDPLQLRYFELGRSREVRAATREFRVSAVLPMTSPRAAERALMPEIPGLADARSCQDWDTGLPIDLDAIQDADEAYWKAHRGAPKALITLAAGQQLWRSDWGELTELRFEAGTLPGTARSALRSVATPLQLGITVDPLRQRALAAAEPASDFSGLFIGFSFLLIIAALVLVGLLFAFGVERRHAELGTLLAVGLRPAQVRRLLLGEALLLALLGSGLGAALALPYTAAVLALLAAQWPEAVAATPLHFSASSMSLLGGVLGAALFALGVMLRVLGRLLRLPGLQLLQGEWESGRSTPRKVASALAWSLAFGVAAAVLLISARSAGQAPAYFGGGALLLLSGIAAIDVLLRVALRSEGLTSMTALALRAGARRRSRSLAAAALFATGTFMVVSIGAFRHAAPEAFGPRGSGTGGFALLARSGLPLPRDLNQPQTREHYALDSTALDGVRVVAMRRLGGDDASCLSIGQAQSPPLLAVKPDELKSRGAFSFRAPDDADWSLLAREIPGAPEVLPAIGDYATVFWGLHLDIGDRLQFRDARGQPFSLQIVAMLDSSVVQGSLFVDEARYLQRFPDDPGYRRFLIDAPPTSAEAAARTLEEGLADLAFTAELASRRLAEYHAVEDSYIGIFQALGALALLLAALGVALLILRNVLERRRELGTLAAVGLRLSQLRAAICIEHGGLLLLGLLVGALAAAAAVLPVATAGQGSARWPFVSAGIAAVVGLAATWLAARIALRGSVLDALRNE